MTFQLTRRLILAVLLVFGLASTASAQTGYSGYIVNPHYRLSDGRAVNWEAHYTIPWGPYDSRWTTLDFHHYYLPVGGGAPNQWRNGSERADATLTPQGVIIRWAKGNVAHWNNTTGTYVYTLATWQENGQPYYWQTSTVYIDNPNN